LLLGGLRTGDNVVWHDESGSLASDFFFNFIGSSFGDETHVVYVSFDRSPKNLIATLGDLAENDLFTILDCFTYGKGEGNELFLKFYKEPESGRQFKIIPIKKPEDPDTLVDTLETVYSMCGGKVNYVFESLTGMQDLWGSEESLEGMRGFTEKKAPNFNQFRKNGSRFAEYPRFITPGAKHGIPRDGATSSERSRGNDCTCVGTGGGRQCPE